MSENKFIKRLHGKETAKSVVEIKNTATPTMFTNMPAGDSNVFNTYSDHRGNVTGVLRGTDNWKLSGSSLVPATTVYGDGRDMTGVFVVGNAGLWIDATYTFTEPKLFTPNTEWVLKLCGNGLLSDSNDTVELTMLIKFGSTMVSKTFFLPEQSFSFSEELVIDFSESVAQTIKVNAGDTMVVQVLCGDSSAQAQIYNGMTVLTALQRRVDAETVASDKKTFSDVVQDLSDLANDVNNCVRKTTTANRIYGTDSNGDQDLFALSNTPSNDAIACFSGTGTLQTNTPVNNTDCANKKYVDDSIGDGTITLTQGGTTKGTFTVNQSGDTTIDFDAGGSSLPSQTGNAGKFLTTDGTDASWTDTLATLKLSTSLLASDGSNIIDVDGNGGFTFGRVLKTIKLNSSFLPYASGSVDLGNTTYKFGTLYANYINNGASITIPNQTGTMLVADSTGAAQGQVLMLDSNLKPAWANPSGGYYPDLFDWKWRDATTSRTDWALSDGNWINQADATTAYSHLVDDFDNVNVKQIEYRDGGVYLFNRYVTGDTEHNDVLYYAWQNTLTPTSIVYTTTENPSIGDDIYNNAFSVTESVYAIYKSSTETIAGTTITYYQATDGHKIVLADQETNTNAIYTATGMAWYYILDNANQRFKLPRAKPLNGGVVGNGMTLGLTDGTNNSGLYWTGNNDMVGRIGVYGANVGTTDSGTQPYSAVSLGVTTDPTKSGIIVERDNTDQCKYLYFYVG